MRDPAGQVLTLSSGPYGAEVVTVGGGLRSLRRDGLDLVAGYGPGAVCDDYRGAVLMPWPNRIADGRYEFAGTRHQLPVNEVPRHNALHGLALWARWTVSWQRDDAVSLACELPPQTGYPFALDLSVEYRLDVDGLQVTLGARNVGDTAAPYGTGHHPYLTVGRRVDDCLLTLPAARFCPMDDRGHPGALRDVAGTAYDFREPRLVGAAEIDNPYGDLVRDAGDPVASLADPETGRAVHLTVGAGFDWLHAYTGDALSRGPRECLAIEPTTCPPDAFNSGIGLVVLGPGESHSASFRISGSAPA